MAQHRRESRQPVVSTPSASDIFLGYQKRVLLAAAQHDILVIEKSRQIGVTWATGARAVETVCQTPADGGRDWHYLSYKEGVSREYIDTCREWAKLFRAVVAAQGAVIGDKGETTFRLDAPSGNQIWGHCGGARTLRSRRGNVMVDEAAFCDDLDDILDAAMALQMWGGKLIVCSTHYGAGNAFNRLCERVRAGKMGKKAAVLRVTFQDALADGLYYRICQKNNLPWSPQAQDVWVDEQYAKYGPAAAQELDVIPSEGDLLYIDRPTVKACMTLPGKPVRLRLPEGFAQWPEARCDAFIDRWIATELAPVVDRIPWYAGSYIGQDFGRDVDLTVIAVGHDTDSGAVACPLVLELARCPFREQGRILHWLLDHLPGVRRIKMDARGNGQALAEQMQRAYGETLVDGVKATESTYLTWMPLLRAALQQQQLLLLEDDHIAADLQSIALVKGVPRIDDRFCAPGRHGDAAIALMHLVAAADERAGAITHAATGQQRGAAAQGFTGANLFASAKMTNRGWGTVPGRGLWG
jgi:phage FluMu gp28-like protein